MIMEQQTRDLLEYLKKKEFIDDKPSKERDAIKSKLEGLTVSQLKDACKRLEISGYSKLKKSEIIELIMSSIERDETLFEVTREILGEKEEKKVPKEEAKRISPEEGLQEVYGEETGKKAIKGKKETKHYKEWKEKRMLELISKIDMLSVEMTLFLDDDLTLEQLMLVDDLYATIAPMSKIQEQMVEFTKAEEDKSFLQITAIPYAKIHLAKLVKEYTTMMIKAVENKWNELVPQKKVALEV